MPVTKHSVARSAEFKHTDFNFPGFQHPELAYREYLRKIWTDGIQKQAITVPNSAGKINIITEAQALSQLQDRFHQDFTTTIVTFAPVNELLVVILTSILTSPIAGGFGLGLPATSVPPRGNASAADYVQQLLRSTGQTADEMSKRYRTQFIRSPTESSNSVWENVFTLQAFYRDSFQSEPDVSHPLPDTVDQPIIPSFLQDNAPFFMEFDEWTAQQQTVPLENYFLIRDIFKFNVTPLTRSIVQSQGQIQGYAQVWLCTAYVDAFALYDQIVSGCAFLDQNNYAAALAVLTAARMQALEMFWAPKKYDGQSLLSRVPAEFTLDIATAFTSRASSPVTVVRSAFNTYNTMANIWGFET